VALTPGPSPKDWERGEKRQQAAPWQLPVAGSKT
jgi:hypothetical protein